MEHIIVLIIVIIACAIVIAIHAYNIHKPHVDTIIDHDSEYQQDIELEYAH
jgi:hypothetical protein